MKLDNDLLRKMVSEALGTVLEKQADVEEQKSKEPSEKSDWMMQEQIDEPVDTEVVSDNLEELRSQIETLQQQLAAARQENESLKLQLDQQRKEPSVPPVTKPVTESFQITKGRLRQIIKEELASAKKQGIL